MTSRDLRQLQLGIAASVSGAWQLLIQHLRPHVGRVVQAAPTPSGLAVLARDCDVLLADGRLTAAAADPPALLLDPAMPPRPPHLACRADDLGLAAAAVSYLQGLGCRSVAQAGLVGLLASGVGVSAAARGLPCLTDSSAEAPTPLGLIVGRSAAPEAALERWCRQRRRPGIDCWLVVIDDGLPATTASDWPVFASGPRDLGSACLSGLRLLAAGDADRRPLRVPARTLPVQVSRTAQVEDNRLVRALSWIAAHAHEECGVDDIAAATGISRRSLQRLFARHLDRSPWSEVLRVRVERARDLLQHSDAPLARIAEQVGFAEADRLSAAFKRFVGCTPGQWRRS